MNGTLQTWAQLAASLAIGLLIGLERERHPEAKAGVRTFALVALFGTLCVLAADFVDAAWTVPLGLAVVAAMLIAAYARGPVEKDPGTTTVIAACVCFLLGVLAGEGETAIAGALAIGVTALLYFKPEIEGMSTSLERQEQVSVLQFLVASFIVLPILPDRTYGPYHVLNPRNIWLMVVLVSGIGLAGYIALRIAGERRGAMLAGLLGGLVSSTATTVLYGKRSGESPAMGRLAAVAVPIANLVPLARVALIAAIIAPATLPQLAPVIGAALAAGLLVTALMLRGLEPGAAPLPKSRNPAELGAAMRFGAFYGLVLFAAAWLSDLAGERGLYAAAALSGFVDIDAIVLSGLNLFSHGRLPAREVAAAIAIAYLANLLFKFAVLLWFNRGLALRAAAPFLGMIAAGAAAFLWL